MKIILINNDYKYAAEQMLLTLFPGEKPVFAEPGEDGDRAEITLFTAYKHSSAMCRLHIGDKEYRGRASITTEFLNDDLERERRMQRIIKLAFYRAGTRALGKEPVWGALTGIRPGKLMSQLLETGLTDNSALKRFCKDFCVSQERAELCLDTAHASINCAESLEKGDICLYIGIPFCPTRCAYCSFVSQSVEKSMKLIEPFLEALYREIDETAKVTESLDLRVISVYLGGGTPTTLSEEQLDTLLGRLHEKFDLSACREITVEAGRPDTITAEKLQVLSKRGVTRISVNPQSMNDDVLNAIGRFHTAEDIENAFKLARETANFDINMDLIAGLPSDTEESFRKSLERVIALEPQNITVHTLAMKKGSAITLGDYELPSAEAVEKMLDYAKELLEDKNYAPYYLYRQKYMSGGFENVGWTKPCHDNIYNICIMEELCSIISMGGGASTKLCTGTGRIERVFAPKYPQEYIERIDKVIADKQKIIDFYKELED